MRQGAADIDGWLSELADEYPDDADWLRPTPDDFIDEPWHQLYFRAFEALRFDRFFGAMGGESPISYLAWTRYADDLGLIGDDRETFHTFLSALDAEYLDWRSETNPAA